MSAKELPKSELLKIDNYLTNNFEIPPDYFDSLLSIYPTNDYIVGMNIYFNYKNGNKKKLEEDFYKLITLDNQLENSSYIQLAKGIIAYNNNSEEEAIKYYKRGLEIDKLTDESNKWLRLELYFFYQKKEFDKALEFLMESLTIDNNFTFAQYELAFINRENGDLEAAIDVLDRIILRTTDPYAIYHKAYFLEELEEHKEAEILYTMLINKFNYIEAYTSLGAIYHYLYKDFTKAEYYFNEALKINQNFDVAYIRLFRLYIDKKELEKAYQAIKKGYTINKSSDNLLDFIYAEVLMKRYTTAKGLIEKYYDEFGKDYEIDFWDILWTILEGDKQNTVQVKIDKYYENYTQNEINFLKSELNAWNVKLKSE